MASIDLNSVLQGALGGFQLGQQIQQGQNRQRDRERLEQERATIQQSVNTLLAPQRGASRPDLQRQIQDLGTLITDRRVAAAAPAGIDAPAAPEVMPPTPQLRQRGEGSARDQALANLVALKPTAAQGVMSIFAAQDTARAKSELAAATRAGKEASFVLDQPDLAAKRRAIEVFTRQGIQRGDAPDNGVRMLVLPEDELDLELQTLRLAAQSAETILTPEKAPRPQGKLGQAIGDRNALAKKREALIKRRGEGDPQVAAMTGQLEIMDAAIAGGDGAASETSGRSFFFDNGTVIQSFKDGSTQVVTPGGEAVTGAEREKTIQRAVQQNFEIQKNRAGSRAAGTAAIKRSEEAATQLEAVRSTVLNLDRAIAALDAGANTGVVEKNLPSFSEATLRLNNIINRLGLDIVSTGKFGQLSDAELRVALSTALPSGMQEADLKVWLQDRKAAEQKLADYLLRAAVFLGNPDNTTTDWLVKQTNEEQRRNLTGPPRALPAADTGGGGESFTIDGVTIRKIN